MARDEIVLSKMFSDSSYLLDNLGHEVINLYQSDGGDYYVYLNDDGMFEKSHSGKVKTVLFIKSVGNCQFQVLGKADICSDIYNPDNDTDVERLRQNKFIVNNNISYGDTLLHCVFVGNKYQYVYLTFKAEKIQPVKDNLDLIISFKDGPNVQSTNNKIVVPIKEKGILSSGGKEYFNAETTPMDYQALDKIINNPDLWGKPFPKFSGKTVDREMAMRSLFARRIKMNNELNKLFK